MLCNKSNELVIWRTPVHRVFKTHLQNWDNASIVTSIPTYREHSKLDEAHEIMTYSLNRNLLYKLKYCFNTWELNTLQ